MYLALLASAMIHAVLLIGFMGGGNGNGLSNGAKGKGNHKEDYAKVRLLDKPTEAKKNTPRKDVLELDKKKSKVVVKKKKKKKKKPAEIAQEYINHDCTQWYGGIGVQHGGIGTCEIVYVAKGYPADRAGVRPGDLTIADATGDCPGRGEPGTQLELKWMRGTQLFRKLVIREKICTSPELTPPKIP